MSSQLEVKEEVIYDSGTIDLTFSMRKQKYIEMDGERHYLGDPERLAVCPGDFESVERFAPELLPVFRSLWTPAIVTAYKTHMEAMRLDLNERGKVDEDVPTIPDIETLKDDIDTAEELSVETEEMLHL